MSREGKKLSELTEELRRSYESGEFNYEVTNSKEILDRIKNDYSDGELNDMDGVAISYSDWRFSVRTSNTEPLLRLNVEHIGKKDLEGRVNELVSEIEKHAVFENLPK